MLPLHKLLFLPVILALASLLLSSLQVQARATGEASGLATILAERSYPLKPSDYRKSDLDPLLDAIGGRRTVLLGEASHGTSEYYRWRASISRRLVEEKGFSFIAVEGDWAALQGVNRYVKHLPGAPESARDALMTLDRWPRWMWANEEVLELVTWLRDYNSAREPDQRVGFYGMDVYGMGDSLAKAPDYMATLDGDLARDMRRALACFEPYIDDPRSYHAFMRQRGRGCEQPLAEVMATLQREGEAYRARDARAWLHAKQNFAVVVRGEKHYRLMGREDAGSWNARARNFHDTLERLRTYYGGDSGAIAWAHNTHMGDVRATRSPPGQENLGMHAREALGRDQVFIVGFGSHRGSVLAGRAWEGDRELMEVPAGVPGSLEDILYRTGEPGMLFILEQVAAVAALEDYIGHRAIGVVYHPEREHRNYVPTLWPERYDGFIYIEETGALSPLHERE